MYVCKIKHLGAGPNIKRKETLQGRCLPSLNKGTIGLHDYCSCWSALVSETRESFKIKSLCLCKNAVVGEEEIVFQKYNLLMTYLEIWSPSSYSISKGTGEHFMGEWWFNRTYLEKFTWCNVFIMYVSTFLDVWDPPDTILGHTELEFYRGERDVIQTMYRHACDYNGDECFSEKVEVVFEGVYQLPVCGD